MPTKANKKKENLFEWDGLKKSPWLSRADVGGLWSPWESGADAPH